jgi:hypothetical protein
VEASKAYGLSYSIKIICESRYNVQKISPLRPCGAFNKKKQTQNIYSRYSIGEYPYCTGSVEILCESSYNAPKKAHKIISCGALSEKKHRIYIF